MRRVTGFAQASSLSTKFRRNFAGYGYTQLVTLAVQFVSVPFFLHYWGSTRYAEWLVITGIPMMLSLLDMGVAHASASKATMLAAIDKIEDARKSLQTSLWFSIGIAVLLIGSVVLLSVPLDWTKLLKLTTVSQRDATLILLVMVAHLGTGLISGSVNAWFRAMDRTSLGIFLHANRRLLDVGITIASLSLGAGPLELAISLLSTQIVYLIAMVWIASKLSPWQLLGIDATSIGELRSVLKPAMAHLGVTAGQVATLQGSLQLLNQIADAETVVIFSMGRTLMRLILQIGVVSNFALRPELSKLIATGRTQQAARLVTKVSAVTFMIAVTTYSLLILLGPTVGNFWSQGQIHLGSLSLAAIGLHALINVSWYVPISYQMATNCHARTSLAYFTASAAALLALAIQPDALPPILSASLVLLIPELAAALAVFSGGFLSNFRRH